METGTLVPDWRKTGLVVDQTVHGDTNSKLPDPPLKSKRDPVYGGPNETRGEVDVKVEIKGRTTYSRVGT